MARAHLKLVGAIAGVTAAAALAVSVVSPARAVDFTPLFCGDEVSHPFMRWADPLPYTLVPGGTFERGEVGWQLSGGARVVAGNEPFELAGGGSRSLFLPEGSSVTSPPMCMGLLVLPVVRFVSTGGEALGGLRVEALYKDRRGVERSIEMLPGALPSRAWKPSPQLIQLASMANALTLNGLTSAVQLRFTPAGVSGGGDWRIDDVFVDPWKGT